MFSTDGGLSPKSMKNAIVIIETSNTNRPSSCGQRGQGQGGVVTLGGGRRGDERGITKKITGTHMNNRHRRYFRSSVNPASQLNTTSEARVDLVSLWIHISKNVSTGGGRRVHVLHVGAVRQFIFTYDQKSPKRLQIAPLGPAE